jgi:hypothetical protein
MAAAALADYLGSGASCARPGGLTMILPLKAGTLMLAAAAVLVHASPGDAKPRRDQAGIVTVCSQYGKGCVSGPTRLGRVEQEVRLPGGSWIGCRRDCKQTLREESIDFFETLNERATDWN